MSNVIKLLEKLASDSKCSDENVAKQVIEASELTEEIKETIIRKDTISLERQLDVTPDIVCFVIPAEDDDESPDDSDDEKEETSILANA